MKLSDLVPGQWIATRSISWVAGAFGLGAAVVLFMHHNPLRVFSLVACAGFGLLWLLPVRLLVLSLNAQGWRVLFPPEVRISPRLLVEAAFIRSAINTLLPVAHIGGEVVAGQFLRKKGIKVSHAVASIVVETTVTLFVQMGFVFLGLVFLLSYVDSTSLVHGLFAGLLIAFPLALVFVFLQQNSGLFARIQGLYTRFAGGAFVEAAQGASVDAEIVRLYRKPGPLLLCAFWQGLSMLGGALELWVILTLLHERAGWRLPLLLETLIQAMQSAAFMVPGTLGIQEGGLIAMGSVAGFSPEVALAVSLIRRVRQAAISLPVLLLWVYGNARSAQDGFAARRS